MGAPPSGFPSSGDLIVAEIVEQPALPPPRPQPHLGWALLWMLAPIAAQFVTAIVVVMGAIFYFAASGIPRSQWQAEVENLEPIMLPAVTLGTLLTSLGVAAIVFGRETGRKLAWRGCAPGQWALTLLLVPPLAVIGGELGNWAMELLMSLGLEEVATFGQDTFTNFSQQPWLLVFVSACLLPGLGEEIFFRGFLSRGLVARHGVIWGSLFASTLFAGLHMAPVQVCATFALGLAMQFVFLTTRSLMAPIGYHIFNNLLAFLAMRYGDAVQIEGVTSTSDQIVSHTAWPLVLASMIAAAAVLFALYKCRTRWIMADGQEYSPGYFATERPRPEIGARPVSPWPGAVSLAALLVGYALFIGAMVHSAQ